MKAIMEILVLWLQNRYYSQFTKKILHYRHLLNSQYLYYRYSTIENIRSNLYKQEIQNIQNKMLIRRNGL